MKQFLLRSFDGKHAYPVNIKQDIRRWDSRKCWAAQCNNEINVVHLTEHGNASHGYCWWCYRSSIVWDIFWGGQGYKRGKWIICDKNYKTKKPFLKEDNSSRELWKSFTKRFVLRKTKEVKRIE